MIRVAWLAVAPVKGLALARRDEVRLESYGVEENRRFYMIDADGRRYGLLRDGRLALVGARWDAAGDTLTLTVPGAGAIEAPVEVDGAVTTDFYGRDVSGRVVAGPFAEALSEYVGRPLRLVRADNPGDAVDRGNGHVSLVSEESLAELARHAGREAIDARRFRMLIGVGGCAPHEEDEWLGRRVRVGDAVIELYEQVARCAITTQDPETGKPDLDTLRILKDYRGARNGDPKAIDFGVFGDVAEPGAVRVGDAVEPLAL